MKAIILTAALVLLSATAYSQPTATPPAAAKPAIALSGKVVESMDSGGYTYILLDTGKKKQWVAVPAIKVQKGAQLTLEPGYEMKNFRSAKLNKSFDSIIFSAGRPGGKDIMKEPHLKKNHPASGATATPTASSEAMKGHGKPAIPAEKKKVKVARATGANAYTVADVYAKAGQLAGKQVTVRGKVVKFSSGIMKRNWIHLADGTGKADAGTDDLLVTSQQTAKLDDVVTVTGVVAKDADFGSGYKYKVLLENATVRTK